MLSMPTEHSVDESYKDKKQNKRATSTRNATSGFSRVCIN